MKLRDYLSSHGLTTADFAEVIGVSQASVSRYASGARRPEWTVLGRIVMATNGRVTANDFMVDEEELKAISRGNGGRPLSEAVAATAVAVS